MGAFFSSDDVDHSNETRTQLGAGGFGTVYQITFNDNRSSEAEKVVKLTGNQYDFREIEHIIAIWNQKVYSDAGDRYLSFRMPLYRQNLSMVRDNIPSNYFCNYRFLVHQLHHMASALAYMHKVYVLHRDIKPQNILLGIDQNTCCVLADFGLAKNIGNSIADSNVGTTSFKAPEVTNYSKYSTPADVFSLGVTFFWVATGKYVPDTTPIIMNRQYADLGALLGEMMHPNPERRPTAHQVKKRAKFMEKQFDSPAPLAQYAQRTLPTPRDLF
jgi:serine/threonine protein kinase